MPSLRPGPRRASTFFISLQVCTRTSPQCVLRVVFGQHVLCTSRDGREFSVQATAASGGTGRPPIGLERAGGGYTATDASGVAVAMHPAPEETVAHAARM